MVANKPKTLEAIFSNAFVILANAPIPSMTPPKTIADAISNIVHNMPIRPPELNNSFKVSLGVSMTVSLKIA